MRIHRSLLRFGRCRADVPWTYCPRQGARVLLIDGTAVESAFALLLTKVTNRRIRRRFLIIAMAGVNKDYVQYLALLLEREVKEYDNKKDNKWHDWSWLTGS